MKNKILVIVAIILVVVLIVGIMYAVDMNMMKNNKPVIFSTWGYRYALPENQEEEENNSNEDFENVYANEYEDFEISVVKSEEVSKNKILNNKELDGENEDYDLYYYGLSEVNVKANNEIIPLEKALKTGKITLERIIEKAKEDKDAGKIEWDGYYDGGTILYKYESYTIMKLNTIDDKNLWIGIPEMTKEKCIEIVEWLKN